ncbi:YwqJ-related putative deaminase [Micromonospora fulviviridis]|uniref:YwqJ-related putative deaminase n=1 Tax=Micromonospora fulviviridis TaxID=47860 RepID=UPI003791F7B4
MFRQRRPAEPRRVPSTWPANCSGRSPGCPRPATRRTPSTAGCRSRRAPRAMSDCTIIQVSPIQTDCKPGHLVRGGERHAEMIVVSDVLHEYDQERSVSGHTSLDFEGARPVLGKARLEFFRIREPGDPAGGPGYLRCDSCIRFLVHFNLLPWPELTHVEQWHMEPQIEPQPGRFLPTSRAHSWPQVNLMPNGACASALARSNDPCPATPTRASASTAGATSPPSPSTSSQANPH